jgi:Helix-turn-helix of DDE superfamily endonuclease
MTYEQMKDLKPGDFKRACGVHPQTFEPLLQVLRAHAQKQVKPGRPPTLALADQLFMSLQDWREYRPSFPIGRSWGVDASVVCRTVQKSANLLSKSTAFQVPGKKPWRAASPPLEVSVVDVAASPVERPPKNRGNTRVGRRNALPRQRRASSQTSRASSSVSP